MTDSSRFKIVFDGQISPDMPVETVKTNLAHLFKSAPEKIEALFSGAQVAIKRDLNAAEADKYLQALHQAGALARKEPEISFSLVSEEVIESAPKAQMQCPKCAHVQEQAELCSACGVVISKYLARQQQEPQTPAAETSPYSTPQAELYEHHSESAELKLWGISSRIGRVRYLARCTAMYLIVTLATLLLAATGLLADGGFLLVPVVVLGSIAAVVFAIQQGVQRLHDIGWSGWLMLIHLIPVVGYLFPLLLMIVPGTVGSNRFGPQPPANTTGNIVLALLFPVLMIAITVASFAFVAQGMASLGDLEALQNQQ